MTRLAFDLEGDNYLEGVTRLWLMCTQDLDTGEVAEYNDEGNGCPSLATGLMKLQEADEVFAHNGEGYDYPVLEKLYGLVLPRSKKRDTLVMSRLINPELPGGHSIGMWGERYGSPKGDHNDFSKYSVEMANYCRRDTEICARRAIECSKELETWETSKFDLIDSMPLYLWIEHETAKLIALQMGTGFPFDIKTATTLAAEFWEERERLAVGVRKVFKARWKNAGTVVPKASNKKTGIMKDVPYTKVAYDEFNPGSDVQVGNRLIELGWKPKIFTDGGQPKVDQSILSELPYPEARVLAEFAKADKKWAQLAAPPDKRKAGGWIHNVKPNGRIHGYVNSCGAVTCRMTHSRPNTGNIDSDPRMRALFLAAEFLKLVGCDAEGLELRMLGHYLARHDDGHYANSVVFGDKSKGTDAHSRTRDIARLYMRDSAKTLIYAMIYGAGDPKIGSVVIEDAKAVGKLDAVQSPWLFDKKTGKLKVRSAVGKAVRARLEEGITGFKELLAGVRRTIQQRGYILGIDGRRLRIRSLHSALNSVLQGGGAVLMKLALILAHYEYLSMGWKYGQDWEYYANVHDEVQMGVRPDVAETAGQVFARSITRAGEMLKLRCPMAGAYAVGNNWSETH